MRTLVICLFPMLLTAGLSAQTVAGSFSPNPVAPGVPVTFTGTDASGHGVNLPSPCGWYRIHQGSQTGPIVNLGIFCIQVIVPIAANGRSRSRGISATRPPASCRPAPTGSRHASGTRASRRCRSTGSASRSSRPGAGADGVGAGPTGSQRRRRSRRRPDRERLDRGPPVVLNNPIFPGACLSDPIFFKVHGAGRRVGRQRLERARAVGADSPVALYQGIHVQSLIRRQRAAAHDDVSVLCSRSRA